MHVVSKTTIFFSRRGWLTLIFLLGLALIQIMRNNNNNIALESTTPMTGRFKFKKKLRVSIVEENENNNEEPLDKSLLSSKSMQEVGASLARTYDVVAHHNYAWCGTKKRKNTRKHGLLYVRVPKTGSTTLASVVHRISVNHGNCNFQNDHTALHHDAQKLYVDRDREHSFLLGSVRDPAARAVSRIFMRQVSIAGNEPTDKNMMEWLKNDKKQMGSVSAGQGGFQLNYMTLKDIRPWSAFDWSNSTAVKNKKLVEQNVQHLLQDYDFMVVSERMEESLVVLQLLLGVNTSDILTLDGKVQGSYYYKKKWLTLGRRCVKLQKSFKSPLVSEYLSSDSWKAQNYGDYLLHAAANESLDRTIEALGRERVERGLEEYQKLKSLVYDACASKAVFPCSKHGVAHKYKAARSCYEDDQGCGYPCIDDFSRKREKG